MTTIHCVLFVGECPPLGAHADFRPFDCASGTRLARSVLGLVDRPTMLEHLLMANLFDKTAGSRGLAWDEVEATRRAWHLLARAHPAWRGHGRSPSTRTIVCLGRRVADAFKVPSVVNGTAPVVGTMWSSARAFAQASNDEQVDVVLLGQLVDFEVTLLYIPHPSGASTSLNSPQSRRDVRRMLLPDLVLGCPTLRPWHFNVSDPTVVDDLAVALCPLNAFVGNMVMAVAAGLHGRHLAQTNSGLLARMYVATNGGDQPKVPPWDEPMVETCATLIKNDGLRALKYRWGPEAAAAMQVWPRSISQDAKVSEYAGAVLQRYLRAGLA